MAIFISIFGLHPSANSKMISIFILFGWLDGYTCSEKSLVRFTCDIHAKVDYLVNRFNK